MGRLMDRDVVIDAEAGSVPLPGTLMLPQAPVGLVVFAHGSGSSRLSPRNRRVAASLAESGLAALLFDLLTDAEAVDRSNVCGIPLLARRVVGAVSWAREDKELNGLPIGLFGSSTGAAAALVAAASIPDDIGAVVSRGGRPDLAGAALGKVKAPTLLIVGGRDDVVIELNETAQRALLCESILEIVPGATHLFEEPGTLEEVERLAAAWFRKWLPGGESQV